MVISTTTTNIATNQVFPKASVLGYQENKVNHFLRKMGKMLFSPMLSNSTHNLSCAVKTVISGKKMTVMPVSPLTN